MTPETADGGNAVHTAIAAVRRLVAAIGIFSLFANLLMLTGPLYMLQVYDRVLASRSVPTLVALTVLIALLFLTLGLIELVRSRLLGRAASRLERRLDTVTFDALIRRGMDRPAYRNEQPLRDLASVRQFLTGPGPLAVFDAPWVPVYLAVIFLMHWSLGLIAVAGALVLVTLAIVNELRTRSLLADAGEASMRGHRFAAAAARNVEAMTAMGMTPTLRRRWHNIHAQAQQAQGQATDRIGSFTTSTKTLRLFLQSLILGAGALLAIAQTITPGMMIAASIILGRALAPIDQLVGQWRSFVTTRGAFARIRALLRDYPPPDERMQLPAAKGALELANVYAGPPGATKPVLKDISFSVQPGEALGVIGPSATGKTTLARVLTGLWPAASGVVRLDGADVALWDHTDLGPQIGYLPQDVELFAGRISDNIARFADSPDPAEIVRAATAAGVHDMILRLPDGYDTEIGEGGKYLSAGQRQRVALARALYGDPVLVVLDEPNSNLDAAGDDALSRAIEAVKADGRTVVVIAHRPGAIANVDKLVMLEAGQIRAFGPKDEVLARVLKQARQDNGNVATIQSA